MNNILVIIVTYNGMKWIDKCIKSIINSTIAADIYVVDNGSNDGTQEYLRSNCPFIIFTQSHENLGFGKANNLGLRYALNHNYKYVYLLNQDAWVMPNTFELLIKILENNPQYGILSPIQLQANMRYLDINFGNYVCTQTPKNEFISDLYNGTLKDVYEVPFVMAAHWLISRKCLEQVGGFSPSFPHYGEDDNLCHRTSYWKFKIGIVPSAKGVHDREFRQTTIEHQIYMFYIGLIRRISNPLTSINHLAFIKDCLINVIRFKSLKVLNYSFKFLTNIHKLRKNKITSIKSQKAFL